MPAFPEFRQAVRGLIRDRAYTALGLLSIAFGIAANTIIFSLVDAVLLRPLHYTEPGRLVAVNEVVAELAKVYPKLPVSARHYLEWRERSSSFTEIGIVEADRAFLTGSGDPERVEAARVSSDLLPMLGARLRFGRVFLDDEDQPGRDNVVILTEALWARRYAADPGLVGRTIMVDGTPKTVVGILDAGFRLPTSEPGQIVSFPSRVQIFVPIALRREKLEWGGPFNYGVIGRLKPGLTVAQAVSELDVLQADISSRIPEKMHVAAIVTGLQDEMVGASRKPLMTLLAAVGAVLLIVCVNLANLSLARGAARSRDVAIRRALGATGLQLLKAALTESLVLGVAGGALGAATAWAGLKVFLSWAPVDLPRLAEVTLDARILGFALGLSVATGLLFGLLPAWRAARVSPRASMSNNSRTMTDSRAGRLTRNLLVGFETALSAILLIVAGLLVASFGRLLAVDPGFRPEHVTTTQLTLPPKAYADAAAVTAFYEEVMARVARIPQVTSTAVTSKLPLEGEDWVDLIRRPGDPRPAAELPPVNYRFCSPEYFQAMGIALVAGATFTDADRGRRVAVISEATARAVWPGEDPVGKTFVRGTEKEEPVTVAGVVRDARISLDRLPPATLYVPYWSTDERRSLMLIVRHSDKGVAAAALRAAVWGLDRDVVVGEVRTMDHVLSESVAGRRFQLVVTALFAASAMLLSCLGIYGVVSWSVSRRRNEIGVRMALGAGSRAVRRMVVQDAMRPVLAGLGVGLVVALSLGRLISSLLFGVSPRDPATIVAVAVSLTIVGVTACYLPARRATIENPLDALRCE
jgi:predicted permease